MNKGKELIETRNEQGKRIIKEVVNNYSLRIIQEIKKEPDILPYLLEELNLIEEEFEDYLLRNKSTNITVYYEILSIINRLNNSKIKQHK